MAAHHTRVSEDGRLVIFAELCHKLNLNPGDSVVIDVTDEELRVRSMRAVVQRVQALVRRYIRADLNLSDELIHDRRSEEGQLS